MDPRRLHGDALILRAGADADDPMLAFVHQQLNRLHRRMLVSAANGPVDAAVAARFGARERELAETNDVLSGVEVRDVQAALEAAPLAAANNALKHIRQADRAIRAHRAAPSPETRLARNAMTFLVHNDRYLIRGVL